MIMPGREVQIALVEDDPGTANLIQEVLLAQTDFRPVAVCTNGTSALSALPPLKPAVVLFDLYLDGRESVVVLRELRRRLPDSLILAITSYEDSHLIFGALCAGADGYVIKGDPALPLPQAIREALEGGRPMSRAVARKVLQHFRQMGVDDRESGLDQLTARELQVLQRIHAGYTNGEIGKALSVSEETIRKAVRSILAKLQVSNRAEAAGRYSRHYRAD